MPDRIVISNTTPIIALALVQRLDLFRSRFTQDSSPGLSLLDGNLASTGEWPVPHIVQKRVTCYTSRCKNPSLGRGDLLPDRVAHIQSGATMLA